jgi:hypothetical protein
MQQVRNIRDTLMLAVPALSLLCTASAASCSLPGTLGAAHLTPCAIIIPAVVRSLIQRGRARRWVS